MDVSVSDFGRLTPPNAAPSVELWNNPAVQPLPEPADDCSYKCARLDYGEIQYRWQSEGVVSSVNRRTER
jgi:hypothetical protein